MHSKRPAPQSQPRTVTTTRSRSVFRSHKKRNILILALIVLAVIGVSAAAAQFAKYNTLALHWHPQLSITSNSSGPVTVPAQIGIDQSLWKDHTLDQYGVGSLAPLHTHDTTGTIHVESNTVRDFTLHEFLSIWGQPGDGSAINGKAVTSLTVDGQAQPTPTADVVLKDGQKIVMVTA